ncbi:ABC transporter permease [Novispirillum itersonii]|uniref:Spermidine/putrescine transport system permease protein n=1 Tax=Novispirillum itersonii TaxID=189 RepID=A0A7W9ZE50_NOVIT|nr:ABC transporter permease [Novispirillum itersonii]MBB6209570.1 spermidine/putrescine transport system permease protein [Novispirillum itersonii]
MSSTAPSSSVSASRVVLSVYMALFFAYLFLPLILMVAAGFNSYSPPSVTQWQGFSLRWFSELAEDQRILQGIVNSVVVATGVILLSLPLGLSGALLLSRLDARSGSLLYGVLVSPVLTPGIILGISTLIFWRQVDVGGGLGLTVMAQSTFIAAYCMLMFMARLQRQDTSLEEAALDLGATHMQVFRRITLPFLRPAMLSAAVIAFLQSIENYNTTVFSIGASHTLVTEIGSRMRFGLTPVVNIIGLLFVTVTVAVAVAYVLLRQRERARTPAG